MSNDNKRLQVTLPHELYTWVKMQADSLNLSPATMCRVLISEARNYRDSIAGMRSFADLTKDMTDEQKQKLMEGDSIDE